MTVRGRRTRRDPSIAVAAALAVAAVAGCGTSATLTTWDGQHIEGHILRNDHGTLLVETRGRPIAVREDAVVGVTHPGIPQMVAGVVVAGLSVPLLVDAAHRCPRGSNLCSDIQSMEVFFDMVTLVTGYAMGAWGLEVHESSRRRAEQASEPRRPVVEIEPRSGSDDWPSF